MSTSNIEVFYAERSREISNPTRVYALVDGLLYGEANGGQVPERSEQCIALFDGTPDASLADAGPWLIDYAAAPGTVRGALAAQAAGSTGVSWLISAYQIAALADNLRDNLDVRLPDGRPALLRFYDARLMPSLAETMSFHQRIQFMVFAFHWLVEIDGKLSEIGKHA
ncbi:DUF4123 domain-containing protein [Paraburkholderia sp. Ac-20342]|uniref:DUF4123 domain-containing protein n=1 Tax=Paraburkholderia sp. Ac-20342 TaxID=2703889 RepID=UPI00198119D2|nr:DUF4123 domain-containing protein [Paraburkholderia sp. Ac-20342]MBN3848727.1 DUF4123 domain-containing protein [Paraburkholderia sp. Ac-20342]